MLTSYKKTIFGALLLIIVIYEFIQVYYSNERPQQHLLPGATPANFLYSANPQSTGESQSETSVSVVEMNRYLKSHSTNKLRSYINKLSPSQIEGVIKQMGVSNLTSIVAQKQFLKCAGALHILRTVPAHIPRSHQHCRNMSFQSSGPVVALGSFPGSGNSWVRQLLESATGIYTGALYCDGSYIAAGMIGEGVTTNNVIAIKIHDWPTGSKKLLNHDKAIYVVRSPFAAILSEQNRYLARKTKSSGDRHTAEVEQDYPSYGMKPSYSYSFILYSYM